MSHWGSCVNEEDLNLIGLIQWVFLSYILFLTLCFVWKEALVYFFILSYEAKVFCSPTRHPFHFLSMSKILICRWSRFDCAVTISTFHLCLCLSYVSLSAFLINTNAFKQPEEVSGASECTTRAVCVNFTYTHNIHSMYRNIQIQ